MQIVKLYFSGKDTYLFFPKVLFTSAQQNIFFRLFAAVPYNHCRNNRKPYALSHQDRILPSSGSYHRPPVLKSGTLLIVPHGTEELFLDTRKCYKKQKDSIHSHNILPRDCFPEFPLSMEWSEIGEE